MPVICVSAKTGEGVSEWLQMLWSLAASRGIEPVQEARSSGPSAQLS